MKSGQKIQFLGIELASFLDKKSRQFSEYGLFLFENDASSVPKIKILEFLLDFCPEMTLAQFPEFGFFVQNSRIGVKEYIFKAFEPETANYRRW